MVSIVWYPSIKPYKNGAVWYNSNGAFTDFSKLNIKHIKSTIIKISKLGVKTVPILLTNFPGFKHNQRTIKKNTVVKTAIQIVKFEFSFKYGEIAISKGTEPALGIPSPGPIDR